MSAQPIVLKETSGRKPNGYWTNERCWEDALKYSTRAEWKKKSGSSHAIARNNGWLDELCQHMTGGYKPKGYWNKERCLEEALKCSTRTEWQKKSRSGYIFAMKNGWLDELCQHMTGGRRPNGYWTKKRCKEDALKYSIRSEWGKKSGSAYSTALRNGWLDYCCKHMKKRGK